MCCSVDPDSDYLSILPCGCIHNQARRAKEIAEYEARWAKERVEYEARRNTVLSEWERTCSLPQSEEVGSVSVSCSCSLVCLTCPILQEKNGKPNVCVTALKVTVRSLPPSSIISIVHITALYLETYLHCWLCTCCCADVYTNLKLSHQ